MEHFDRSCPAEIVLPAPTAQLLRRRAVERWGAGGMGPNVVSVWPSDPARDTRPIGAFALRWDVPAVGEATICQLAWDGARASAEQVRGAINALAGWPVAWYDMPSTGA